MKKKYDIDNVVMNKKVGKKSQFKSLNFKRSYIANVYQFVGDGMGVVFVF